MDAAAAADDPRSLRRVRAAISFAFFNAMTWQVALGTPMVLFAESLGASAAAVGLAYSFVFLLTPVQVLSTSLLPRYGYKRMMLSGWGSRSLALLPPVAIAWMRPEPGTAVVFVFIGSLFFFTFLRAIGSCAWLPWMNSLLTAENRGRYFASDQAASGVAGVATLLVCSWSLHVMPLYAAFLVQYVFAFVGAWLAYVALTRLPDAPRPSALPLRDVVQQTPRLVLDRGGFRHFVVIGVCVGAAVTGIPPFCVYYLKVVPHVAPAQIVLYTTLQYVGVILGALIIRNHIDRLGPRLFIHLSLAIYTVIALFWIGALRGWLPLGPVGVVFLLVGVAASCWASANMKYLAVVVAPEKQTLAYSVHAAVTSIASGVSPVIWGLFIKGESTQPSVDSGAFQFFFGAVVLSAIVIAILVSRLPAAAGPGAEWLLGGIALRPFRGVTSLASLVLPSFGREAAPRESGGDDAGASRGGGKEHRR